MANNLKSILKLRDKSQIWLARELGVSESAISEIISEKRKFPPELQQKISQLLEVDPKELLKEDSPQQMKEASAPYGKPKTPEEIRAFYLEKMLHELTANLPSAAAELKNSYMTTIRATLAELEEISKPGGSSDAIGKPGDSSGKVGFHARDGNHFDHHKKGGSK